MNDIQSLKQEIQELKTTVKKLQTFNQMLQNSSSIPLAIDQSFRARFISNILLLSSKPIASATQSVNESGSSSYGVAKTMDGFKLFNDGGTPIYIPYYL